MKAFLRKHSFVVVIVMYAVGGIFGFAYRNQRPDPNQTRDQNVIVAVFCAGFAWPAYLIFCAAEAVTAPHAVEARL